MRIRSRIRLVTILSLLALLVSPAPGKIIYVDDDAPAPGDGTSWTTAYRYLQDALTEARRAEVAIEIRVAQGIYKPDQGRLPFSGDQQASFRVSDGVTLKGGYYGQGDGSDDARNIKLYESILSGDLAGDDMQVLTPDNMKEDPGRIENSYHVVTIPGTGDIVIDGFTITGAHIDPRILVGQRGPAPHGGGVRNSGYVTLSNCTFTGNLSGEGAALYSSSGRATLIDCVFYHNLACMAELRLADGTVLDMHGRGGAICVDSWMVLDDCTFQSNSATSGGAICIKARNGLEMTNCTFNNNLAIRVGGAIRNESADHQKLTACEFRENSAGMNGGAIFSWGGRFTLSQCLLSGNSANHKGGAIYAHTTDLVLENCTSVGNRTLEGAALALEALQIGPSRAHAMHCILQDSESQIAVDDAVDLTLTYTNILGGWAGQGNIDVDPCFVDPGYWDVNGTPDDPNDDFFVAGDYHLLSEAGRWDPNVGAWVRDAVTSPCIDAGDPNSEVGDEVWPHGGRINMGAYGGTREASISTEPSEMLLPRIACIHWYDSELAESCQSFLQAYGCSVALVRSEEIVAHPMDDYDLIVIATDTASPAVWSDPQTVTTLTESGKPILGLGEGGYVFFGQLGLNIGYPNGARTTFDSVQVLDSEAAPFTTPYPVTVPADGILQLFESPAQHVLLYLWPAVPEGVTVFAGNVDSTTYYPLAAEQGHLLWGFTGPPETMTQAGQQLFLNAVILTANGRLE